MPDSGIRQLLQRVLTGAYLDCLSILTLVGEASADALHCLCGAPAYRKWGAALITANKGSYNTIHFRAASSLSIR